MLRATSIHSASPSVAIVVVVDSAGVVVEVVVASSSAVVVVPEVSSPPSSPPQAAARRHAANSAASKIVLRDRRLRCVFMACLLKPANDGLAGWPGVGRGGGGGGDGVVVGGDAKEREVDLAVDDDGDLLGGG